MNSAIADLVRTTLLIIGALFPIVNPAENIPVFLALTYGLSPANRSVLARKIAVNGFGLLIVSVLTGTRILEFFGISLPIVQVGGGLVLAVAGWRLLNRADDDAQPRDNSAKTVNDAWLSRRAFYPLTLPLTVGPGSISVAITLGASRPRAIGIPWILPVAALIGCTTIAVAIYLAYRFAEPIGRLLGETAMSIFIRLSSFILLCIGVQFIWNGVSKLLFTIF